MIDARRYLVHDLPEWLESAAKELVPLAKERIRSEIEAHYAEAVAAHLVEGLSEAEARRKALADLGSPDEAAKRFRKQHLTAQDAENVERALRKVRSYWWLLISYLIFCGVWFWAEYFYRDKPDHLSFAVLLVLGFVAAVIIPTVGFVMMGCKSKNIGFFLLADGVALCVFLGWLYYFLVSVSGDWGFAVINFVVFIWTAFPLLRVRLKLRQIANLWDELPPA